MISLGSQQISICFLSNIFPPVFTGSANYTWMLSRRLAARGHRVTVVTANVSKSPPLECIDGVSVHRIPAIRLPRLALAHNFNFLSFTFLPVNYRLLTNLFQENKFDVIHQQNHVFDTILLSNLLRRRFNLPLFLTIHTWAQHTNPIYNQILKRLDCVSRQVIFNHADCVISPDPVVQKYVLERHRVRNSPVIPYGIEVQSPCKADVDKLKQKYFHGPGPFLLSLGHVNALRDRIDLINAMPEVVRHFPSARLFIVGGISVNEPVDLVQSKGLQEHIAFIGAVAHSEVPAWLALCDLEVHTFNGLFPGPGIASLEAMAVGLPVVTMEIDPCYDFSHFRNWENVVMVPVNKPPAMASALLRLLVNVDLRRHIGNQAKEMVEANYSWESICKQHEILYQSHLKR